MDRPWLSLGPFLLRAPYGARRFATPFEDHDPRVGREIFEDFVEAMGGSFEWQGQDPALLESFDKLADDDFDPSLVHREIRRFYEHTARFKIQFTIDWNPWIQPLGYAYATLVARLLDQLRVPPKARVPRGMQSAYALIDLDRDGREDYRGWLRTLSADGSLFYAGAVYTYDRAEPTRQTAYLCVAFPLPGCNLTTVLKPRNWRGDGFEMCSHAPETSDAGTYLIFPHRRSFSMAPGLFLGERFRFRVTRAGWIEGEHEETWLGVRAFTIRYRIE